MKTLAWIPLSIVFIFGVGFTIPGCPDTTAMTQQMEQMTAKNIEFGRKIQTFEQQNQKLQGDLTELMNLVQQINTSVSQHKEMLDKITAQLAQPKPVAAPAVRPKTSTAKPRRR